MSCGCDKPEKNELWTPTTDFRQPTEILPSENIDCYAKRANTLDKDKIGKFEENRIDNTSLATDLNLIVDETFKLTASSTKRANSWRATVGGQSINNLFPNIFNAATGQISGTIPEDKANKNYEVLVIAYDASGEEIDSRAFNFFPKKASKDNAVKFVWPFFPRGKVTSRFGPRKPIVDPRSGTPSSSQHSGIDIASGLPSRGDILAAGDGTVTRCGPGRGWGNVIFIEHRDANNKLVATTVYGHWEEAFVKVGQKVGAGQKIAKEGNAGVSTGAHLHFELHRGAFKNPVDPMPYLNGQITFANDNLADTPGAPNPAAGETTITNSDRGMTADEAKPENVRCPKDLSPLQKGDAATPQASTPEVAQSTKFPESQAAVKKALDESGLSEEDKKLLMFIANIESGFKPDAKNPASSARGIYQMLDSTAEAYYKKIGVPATIENRNDPFLATKAQVAFFKDQSKLYDEFVAKGTLAGKTLSPELQQKYAGLSKGEFIYGLIHHDGVGNAVRGNDMQGVAYYRQKTRQG